MKFRLQSSIIVNLKSFLCNINKLFITRGIMEDLLDTIFNWNWSSIIQTSSIFLTMVAAFCALGTWKKQHKTQLVVSFLNELTDEISLLRNHMNVIFETYKVIDISIISYKEVSQSRGESEIKGIHNFIQK